MRFLTVLIAAWLVAGAASLANAAEPSTARPMSAAEIRFALVAGVAHAPFSPRVDVPDEGNRVLPAQLPACAQPGAQRCVNGWVWWCQCYSFGCHWTTGSARC